MLTEKAIRDRKWGAFPALRILLEKHPIPLNYYGPTSVSDNIFLQLNRSAEIAVVFKEHARNCSQETTKPAILHQLLKDFERLESQLRWAASFFIDHAAFVRQLMDDLLQRLEHVRRRYEGCMLGLAIGDALGWPVEFLQLSEIHARFGPGGITDLHAAGKHPRGTVTDDTQMSLALARAILSYGVKPEDEFVTESARQFVRWAESDENDRAPGQTCMSACRALELDPSWRAPGHNDSKGCGTAMRAAPIGLAWNGDEDQIIRRATMTSELTHGHPCATAGSVATALLVSWALEDLPPDHMFDRLVERTRPISNEFVQKIKQVPTVLLAEPAAAYQVLGGAWTAEEAIACALYAFMRSPRDYRQTVITAVNMDGDSDSVGCIAGAISGAFNGVQAIPESWRQDVEHRDELIEVARNLHAFSAARA